MDNVDHEAGSAHSNPKADDASTSTLGKKRKRDGVTKRGIVAMKKVIEARKNGIKIKVQFNLDGQPIGPNKSTYSAYIGLLGRTMVSLTENDWRFVPPTTKQAIWEDIEQCFEVDETVMHMTLKKVGKAAREFRSKMSKKCFDDEGNPNPHPPSKYAKFDIVCDCWKEFVNTCGEKGFMELSATNSNNAKNKKRQYRRGALGYAQLKENMKDDLEKEPPARQGMIIWKAARVDKNGKVVEEDVQRVVDEGDSIAEKLTSEEMMRRGPNDVLAKAIKKEYHGRVLTAGSCVTKKGYFGKRRETSRDVELHRLTQVVLQMEKQIKVMGSQLEAISGARAQDFRDKFQSTPIHVPATCISERGSCHTFDPNQILEGDLGRIPEGESMCDLFVESPTYAKVGSGLVFKQEGHKVHNVPLKSNEVQVCLKEVVAGHEETPLPLQNEVAEIYTVGDANGTFVVWPLVLVSLQKKVSEVRSMEKSAAHSVTPYAKNKPAYPRTGDLDPVACYHICMAFNLNNNRSDSISVLMPDAFWGTAFTDHVGIENIREVLKLGWLSATSISLYIKYLCDVFLVHEEDSAQCSSRNQLPSRYSFTSPHIVAGHTHIVDVLQKHEGQDHLVMIPYNIEHHWVLVAINTMTENIYYMDPLRVHHTHPERKRLEHMIKSAMNSYRANKKGSVSSGRLRQIQWFDIECPKHDLERGYCGYYICLFIEDILESEATTVPDAYVQKRRCTTFSDDRIEQVQREWCGYLYNRFLKDIINSSTR